MWSFGMVKTEGNFDTVTIFGAGDFAERGEPFGMETPGLALPWTGPMDLTRGDIGVVWTPSWFARGDAVGCKLETI